MLSNKDPIRIYEKGDLVVPRRKPRSDIPRSVKVGLIVDTDGHHHATAKDLPFLLYGVYWDNGEISYCLESEVSPVEPPRRK